MKVSIIRQGRGIIVRTSKFIYALDSAEGIRADYHIISHAHSDHIPNRSLGKIVASEETLVLASYKRSFGKYDKPPKTIDLIDSGHILGSKAVLIEDEILYTGDLNTRSRLFIKGFKPPSARILIIEATYGDPRFKFKDFNSLADEAIRLILKNLNQGKNIVVSGYSLGKSQILTKLFSWYENLYVTKRVKYFNELYRCFGIELGKNFKEWAGRIKQPFILIGYNSSREVKEAIYKFNAVPIKFTGWVATNRAGLGFPISDHADFYDLLRVVDRVNPEKVYVFYGFKNRFATSLRNLGYDAEAI